MATTKITTKKANSESPQVVTLVVDDSGSMSDQRKCQVVSDGVQQMVMEMQSGNLGAGGYRYLINIAKFGDSVTALAECAPPESIDLNALQFVGDSGETKMVTALDWAASATEKSIQQLRALPRFKEEAAPNPIVVFFSDGENTGPDVMSAAMKLKSLKLAGGSVDVVACGIEMTQNSFENVMKVIASREELAVNIDLRDLGRFLAEVKKTVINSTSADKLVDNFD